jgi:hypothetical protein
LGRQPVIRSGVDYVRKSIRAQIALVTIGGRGQRLRIRLSNEFGFDEVIIGAAHIALAGSNGSIQASSDRVLTFNGQQSVTIPAGAPVVSDPVNFDLGAPLASVSLLAVSLYLPYRTTVETVHPMGLQTAYITDGNTTGVANLSNTRAVSQSRFLLSRIEVAAPFPALVALGDSITDGYGSTLDANERWPDYLAQRLANSICSISLPTTFVMNAGISGNRLLRNDVGPQCAGAV